MKDCIVINAGVGQCISFNMVHNKIMDKYGNSPPNNFFLPSAEVCAEKYTAFFFSQKIFQLLIRDKFLHPNVVNLGV